MRRRRLWLEEQNEGKVGGKHRATKIEFKGDFMQMTALINILVLKAFNEGCCKAFSHGHSAGMTGDLQG